MTTDVGKETVSYASISVLPSVGKVDIQCTQTVYLSSQPMGRGVNMPFTNYPLPLFQNESTCETIHK